MVECCFPYCERRIPEDHVTCNLHWHCLPIEVRREVQKIWRGRLERQNAINYVLAWVRANYNERTPA
jgi:hypothetical protein